MSLITTLLGLLKGPLLYLHMVDTHNSPSSLHKATDPITRSYLTLVTSQRLTSFSFLGSEHPPSNLVTAQSIADAGSKSTSQSLLSLLLPSLRVSVLPFPSQGSPPLALLNQMGSLNGEEAWSPVAFPQLPKATKQA